MIAGTKMRRFLIALLLVLFCLPCLAKAAVPSDLAGRTFNEGDEGWRIEELKAQLKELGYYTPKAKYDDIFNDGMVERVKEFQENNKMYPSGTIDPKTLELMYDPDCIKGEDYRGAGGEPDATLIIPLGSMGSWKNLKGDMMSMMINVKNVSQSRTVVGYELTVRTENERGRTVQERVISFKNRVEPGKKNITGYFDLEEKSEIARIEIGITEIRYSDGDVVTISDPDIVYWTL